SDEGPVDKPEGCADEAKGRADEVEVRSGQPEKIARLKRPGGEGPDETCPGSEDAGGDRRGSPVPRERTTERHPRDRGDHSSEPSQDRNLLEVADQYEADRAEDEEPERAHRHEASGACPRLPYRATRSASLERQAHAEADQGGPRQSLEPTSRSADDRNDAINPARVGR